MCLYKCRMFIVIESLTHPGYRGGDRRYPVNNMASCVIDVTPKFRHLLRTRCEANNLVELRLFSGSHLHDRAWIFSDVTTLTSLQ